ncbi:MAG: membrane protein insertase YidC [Micrococcales bacterium]|nr:membrane protein insertase YidC [Micrococcales bacterium]
MRSLSVNPFDLPPLAAALAAASTGLAALAAALEPLAGAASAALAIVLVTLAVRAALIPLGRAQVRAESVRRRLAPRLRELRTRYRTRPETLQAKTFELYRAEGAHPLTGMWTVLVQLPVVGLLYAAVTHPSAAGSVLLSATLYGAPLGDPLLTTLTASAGWPAVLVVAAVLGALAVTATLARRQQLRLAALDGSAVGLARAVSLLSYLTVGFALIAPLAAGLYLVVSTTWTLAERTILRRIIDPAPAV